MSPLILFPHLQGFRLRQLTCNEESITLECERTTPTASCPICQTTTRSIHSRYRRVIRDLPISGKMVLLLLHVRKFYCKEPTCPRQVFAERLPQLTSPHGQATAGLRLFLATLGREAGGAGGARSAAGIGLQTTARTLLRVLHAQPVAEPESPRVVGLDDWAWKKRSRYGALVVDLESRRPIALLEQRSVAVVAAWLRQHPTIEIVARDRSEEFAAAIREALPQAVQVADRFHLISNLVEHLDRFVARQWKHLCRAMVPPASIEQGEAHASYNPTRVQRRLANAEKGATRYQQALALRERGLKHQQIGQRLGVSAHTIGLWFGQGWGPATQRRRKKLSGLDRFVPYLLHRWAEGCRNGTVLHRELVARGYSGGARTVYKFLQSLRASPPPSPRPQTAPPLPSPLDGVTPRHVVRWLLQPIEERASKTQEFLTLLAQADREVAQVQLLVEEFLILTRKLQGTELEPWLERVKATGAREILQFAHGLERDKAAVVAGLTLPYSTGPVEGHINRLKLLKRQSYGRAGVAHLSRRLLAA